MTNNILILPILIPLVAAVLTLMTPGRWRYVKEAITLLASFGALLVASTLFGKDGIYTIPWAGFGFDFSLGACAFSGTGLPIDREFVRKELGFATLTANSIDSVSDRDFILEVLSVLTILSVHLSRIARIGQLVEIDEPGQDRVVVSEALADEV